MILTGGALNVAPPVRIIAAPAMEIAAPVRIIAGVSTYRPLQF
jgi:hypothetical protein